MKTDFELNRVVQTKRIKWVKENLSSVNTNAIVIVTYCDIFQSNTVQSMCKIILEETHTLINLIMYYKLLYRERKYLS